MIEYQSPCWWLNECWFTWSVNSGLITWSLLTVTLYRQRENLDQLKYSYRKISMLQELDHRTAFSSFSPYLFKKQQTQVKYLTLLEMIWRISRMLYVIVSVELYVLVLNVLMHVFVKSLYRHIYSLVCVSTVHANMFTQGTDYKEIQVSVCFTHLNKVKMKLVSLEFILSNMIFFPVCHFQLICCFFFLCFCNSWENRWWLRGPSPKARCWACTCLQWRWANQRASLQRIWWSWWARRSKWMWRMTTASWWTW